MAIIRYFINDLLFGNSLVSASFRKILVWKVEIWKC